MIQAARERWRDFLSAYRRVHVYSVDPGAHAIAREMVPIIRDAGQIGFWFADGWSARQQESCRLGRDIPQAIGRGDTLILGSQTDFSRTQSVIGQAAATGVTTIFVFDHWKNYAQHFGSGALTDVIVVPDALAREHLTSALGQAAAGRVRVLPHLGIVAATERITKAGLRSEPGLLVVLLDPTESADGLGYDWRSTLAVIADEAALEKFAEIAVKPHPRQDPADVAGELAMIGGRGVTMKLDTGDVEALIGRATEVWGMTTIALNVALAAGKQIRSFQVGRNEAGVRASNPHIEPFVVTSIEKHPVEVNQ